MSDSRRQLLEELNLLRKKSTDLSSLIQIVLRDDLTELYNRRYFRQRLEEERKRVDVDKASLAIIMLDIDDFKHINDSLGHLKGDEVLVRIGKLISSSVRSIDIVCRYAGDEFVVILPSAGRREAGKISRRILKSITEYNWEAEIGTCDVKVCASLGYAAYPRESRTMEELIQKADTALYASKKEKIGPSVAGIDYSSHGFRPVWNEDSLIPFLERKAETVRLTKLREQAGSGKPSFVLVEGPSGSGKTRLVKEFLKKLDNVDCIVCKGSATVGTAQMQLFPVREALASLHRNNPSEFHSACSDLQIFSMKHLSRFLPPGTLNQHHQEDGFSERYHVFESISSFIRNLSKLMPLIFIMEDLQWADDGTIDLLSFLKRHLTDVRVMILATLRSGHEHFLSPGDDSAGKMELLFDGQGWELIQLNNLNRSSTGRLVKYFLGIRKVPAKLTNDLYRLTDGNPMFLQETLAYLLQHNMIGEVLKKGIDYTADSPVLPQSVLDMIKGRFRELSLSVRRMLQAASVIGYEFQVAYLMALLDEREGKLYDMLDVARKENFVKEKYVHGTEYFSFNNSLIRDIIYHDMNSRKRKTYHLKIGQILESENRTDDAAGLGRLASHFESGGRQAKAFGYLIHAAQKAKELYASREAIGYLSRALELSKKCSQEEIDKTEVIECRELLGDLQFQVGSIEKARSNYSELLKNGCLEKEKVIRIQRKMGELLERECKYDKAQTFLYKALNGVSSKEDPEYMNIVIALSVVFMRRGQVDKALHYCKTLLDIPRGRENDRLSAKIDFIIGCCHLSKGNVKEALSCFRRSLKIRQKSGDLLSVGFTYLNMGIALFTMGRQKIASRYWNKAIKIGQKTSSAFLEMAARNNAAICCDRTDDPDATLSALWEAYRLARKMGNLVGVASCRNNIGALHKEMGKFDQAVIEFKKCQDIAEKMENFELIAKANINLGTVYVDVMELERAENHAWKLLELTSKHNLKVEEGLSWRLLGDVNYQRRNFSWALDCYHRARGCHEGFILDHDESKSITELKILETSCISDDTDEWYKDFEKKFSKIRGRKKEFHFQSRVSKAAVLIEKRRDTKKALRLLREALEIIGRDSPRTLDLWRVCSMLTKAYCAVGDLNRARESSALAEEALKRIRKCNKEKKYVKAFLAREDVKEFLCLKKMLEKKH